MIERVISCPLSDLENLSGQRYAELGRSQDILWASVSDDALLAIKERNPGTYLLYFSTRDYEDAVRGLAASDVEQAILKRRNNWTPVAHQHFFNQIYRAERRSLTLTSLAHDASKPEPAAILQKHFDETIGILARIVGEGRYDDVALTEMLIFTLESEAELLEEVQRGAESFTPAHETVLSTRLTDAMSKRESYARSLGAALGERGQQAYRESLPFVDLVRAFLVTPRDEDLLDALRSSQKPFIDWQDGVVARFSLREIHDLVKQGKSAELIYRNGGEFLEDLQELTTAQIIREFEDRVRKNQDRPGRALTAHLNALHLEHLLLKKHLLDVARAEDPELASAIAKQVADEATALRAALNSDSTWLTDPGTEGHRAFSELQSTESDIAQDARLFAGLCGLAGNAELQSRFLALLKIKEDQVTRIGSLRMGKP